MRMRNCPKCYGKGRGGHAGKCGFCHGKKKVTSEYCQWFSKREKYEKKISEQLWDDLEFDYGQRHKVKMEIFDKKHPKPKKF